MPKPCPWKEIHSVFNLAEGRSLMHRAEAHRQKPWQRRATSNKLVRQQSNLLRLGPLIRISLTQLT
ncbi:MAG: hypothetical protein ACLQVY_03665 [Limisphaerales bacterium]